MAVKTGWITLSIFAPPRIGGVTQFFCMELQPSPGTKQDIPACPGQTKQVR